MILGAFQALALQVLASLVQSCAYGTRKPVLLKSEVVASRRETKKRQTTVKVMKTASQARNEKDCRSTISGHSKNF